MLIAQILNDKGDDVRSVPTGATLREAAVALHEWRIGCLMVVDADGELAGVLSERDIVREIGLRGPVCLEDSVESAMTRSVVVASPEDAVDYCLSRMTDRRIRHLPVCREGRLVGVVSIGDLVKTKIRAVEFEAEAMRNYIAAAG